MIYMKTTVILAGIALCLLLLASPVAASDYTLEIFGNANEDDTINMQDVTYTELIILEYRDRTELADAKYDGDIDILDMTQIALIILEREKELTMIDFADNVVTVKKPIERIVVTWRGQLEIPRSLKIEPDRVVGVESWIQQGDYKLFFAEYQDKPAIGSVWTPDGEAIMMLNPDIVFLIAFPGMRGSPTVDVVADALEAAGITVFRVYGGVYGERIVEEAEKLGYIFDKRSEAEEFIDWYDGVVNSIEDTVESIPEDDRPTVYYESSRYATTSERSSHIAKTGGKDIFEEKSGDIDPEEVATQNPDIIVILIPMMSETGGMGTDDTAGFEEIRDELMSRIELQEVPAVRTGKVYVLSNFLTGSGPQGGCRSFVQDAYMAKWFNPTFFEDLDPQAIHQEYLTEFQGLDYDLDEHGVYVYHPEEHPDGH